VVWIAHDRSGDKAHLADAAARGVEEPAGARQRHRKLLNCREWAPELTRENKWGTPLSQNAEKVYGQPGNCVVRAPPVAQDCRSLLKGEIAWMHLGSDCRENA
jgi:hypothetical protein